MWPWEHALVAYVGYSLLVRVLVRRPPSDGAAVAVVAGSQFPDIVDKPLAWVWQVLPAGRSLAHSLLFVFPVVTLVLLVAWGLRRTDLGVAFGVGYLSHLPADVVYPALLGEEADVGFLLFPLVPIEEEAGSGVVPHLSEFFADFTAFLATDRGFYYLSAEVGLLVFAILLWVVDGKPGLGLLPGQSRNVSAG
jgi:membrane-bound metal-dependent hydrolase YbcI (DUF457 family)